MKKQLSVLFLCTGNSCRSHMAEAITNHFLPEKWKAVSAGTKPSGYVHPKALQVLNEIGIDHQGESKLADHFREHSFDLVITVCDSAAEECPIWLGKGKKTHIGFEDPAEAEGSEEEILTVFRTVRDQIQDQILSELERQYSILQNPMED